MKEKRNAAPATIDEYILAFPEDVQDLLIKVRKVVQEAAPEAVEEIKYGIPTFVFNGNLVHFAAFKNHIGFYPAPSGIEKFQDALSAYKNAKGSVQFPLDCAIPYSLIKRIVIFRVKENRAKSSRKTTKRQ